MWKYLSQQLIKRQAKVKEGCKRKSSELESKSEELKTVAEHNQISDLDLYPFIHLNSYSFLPRWKMKESHFYPFIQLSFYSFLPPWNIEEIYDKKEFRMGSKNEVLKVME